MRLSLQMLHLLNCICKLRYLHLKTYVLHAQVFIMIWQFYYLFLTKKSYRRSFRDSGSYSRLCFMYFHSIVKNNTKFLCFQHLDFIKHSLGNFLIQCICTGVPKLFHLLFHPILWDRLVHNNLSKAEQFFFSQNVGTFP